MRILRLAVPARFVTCVLLFCGALLLATNVAQGQGAPLAGIVRGERAAGHGRIVLSFPSPVGAAATVAGGVLIVRFDRKVALGAEALATSLRDYVSAARIDPDQMSMRLALVQSLRTDVKFAAEDVYIDLLPVGWKGAPPPLPAAIVAKMAERLRAPQPPRGQMAMAVPPSTVTVTLARAPGRTRLTFALPPGIAAKGAHTDGRYDIRLPEGAVFDAEAVRAALAQALPAIAFPDPRHLRVELPAGSRHQAGMEDGAFVLDILDAGSAATNTLPDVPPSQAEPSPPPAVTVEAPARRVEAAAAEAHLLPDGALGLRITPRTPAAVFERDGVIRIVLAQTRSLRMPRVEPANTAAGQWEELSGEQYDGWSSIRLRPKTRGIVWVTGDAEGWTVQTSPEPSAAPKSVMVTRVTDHAGRQGIDLALAEPAEPIWLDDPESTDRLAVVATVAPPQAMATTQRFLEFALPQTALGIVLEARADDLTLRSDLDGVRIRREAGLTLSSQATRGGGAEGAQQGVVFDTDLWAADRRGDVRETGLALLNAAADAGRREKTAARLRLAGYHLANGLAREAAAVLSVIAADDVKAPRDRRFLLFSGLAQLLLDHPQEAGRILAEPPLALDAEAALLRAALAAREGRTGPALEIFRQQIDALERMPEPLQALVLPQAVEAALAGSDSYRAAQFLAMLEQLDAAERDPGLIPLYQGRISQAAGRHDEALAAYAVATRIGARPVEAEARLQHALLGQAIGRVAQEDARAELETVGLIWRRGPVEVQARGRLAMMAAADGRWRDAFLATRRAVEILPDHPETRALQDEMGRRFEGLFLGSEANRLSKIETLAIFDEFRALTPPGPKGDAIARRLADRLIDLDLLPQAIELMEYQVSHRLKGAARAEAAAQLALLQLVEGRAQEGLATLRATRFAALPADVKQARLHLEARALGELSRIDLALEILGADHSFDAERLRGDLLWRGKRWAEAGVTYERAYGARWQEAPALESSERGDILRAAIAYVLAGDKLGVDRLRTKFIAKMADSADGELFRLITIDHLNRPDAFRAAARSAVSAGSLGDLLSAYRKRFPVRING